MLEPLAPPNKLRALDDAAKLKVGTATVRLMVAVLFRVPDVPVTVTLTVPAVTELAARSVRVVALALLTGLNEAVTPLGRPVAAKVTAPVNPFC